MNAQHLKSVKQWYANANTSDDTVNSFLDVIEEKYGLKTHQLMHADSMCCDDVNAIQYPPRAFDMLGPFHMGGLDGYPFAGLTGMGAFAHHVPEEGAVVIFYAPHIGVTKAGELGKISRYGQGKLSSCCGAAAAGLAKLKSGGIKEGEVTDIDYQMNTLEQIMLKSKDRILNAENQVQETTEVIYEAIDKQMDLLISKTEYPCDHLFQIGGIFINGDRDMGSYCCYRRFDYVDLKSGKKTDLKPDFFAKIAKL